MHVHRGIAHRWNDKNNTLNKAVPEHLSNWKNKSDNTTYHLYSLRELKALSMEEIKKLSPAEKFDILSQRYDYPTVKSEFKRTKPDDPVNHLKR